MLLLRYYEHEHWNICVEPRTIVVVLEMVKQILKSKSIHGEGKLL